MIDKQRKLILLLVATIAFVGVGLLFVHSALAQTGGVWEVARKKKF